MTNRRIIVLQLINSYSIGGAEVLGCAIASRLPAHSFESHACALFEDDDPIAGGQFRRELARAGVGVHHLGKTRFQKSGQVLWKLRQLIRRLGVQIIHTHGISPDLHAALALFGLGSPIVVRTLHSTKFEFHSRMQQWIERLLRFRFARNVAISNGVREWALSFGMSAQTLLTIQNGIDVAAYATAIPALRPTLGLQVPESGPLLISVGRMDADEVKGFGYLIEAMALLVSRGRDTHLLLVGDGIMRPQYEARCRELGIAGHVTFLGRRHDVPSLLKACQLFVLASVREGFGLVLCEAGAAGLPVVATRIQGLDSVIEDGVDGVLVPPRSPEALATAIDDLLSDPEMAGRMATALARKVKDQYSLDRVVLEHAELYTRLASGWRP